jgi:hypothetical protein
MKTKKIFLMMPFLSLIMGIGGCEKENGSKEEFTNNPGTLLGRWQWEKTYLTIPLSETNPQTPTNTGIDKTLILNTDSSWILIENGSTSIGEKFTTGNSISYDLETPFIFDSICFYKNEIFLYAEYYKLYGNTLDFCDCYRGAIGAGVTRWKYINNK